ncbi:N-alpha-acetyltransferase 30 [Pholidichthys leucotaenia]
MATVPPGPSSALPPSPAQSPPFPGDGAAEPAVEGSEPGCPVEQRVPAGAGKKSQSVSEGKRSVKRKQKNMLTRASPAALHLKMQAGEQQQLNGLASPSEHAGDRPDDPGASEDHCDTSGDKDKDDHCKHEGPNSENGSHSPLVNNSINGMPVISRAEGACDGDLTQIPRPQSEEPPFTGGPGVDGSLAELPQSPVEELARLDLSDGHPSRGDGDDHAIRYVRYESELQMPWIMRLITKDLSEPYSIYTYRYFIHNWPQLCFLAMVEQECVGAIVCKLDMHKKMFRRGYIAMLAVDSKHRRKSIGTNLVKKAIYAMVEGDCDEVVLETEITNKSALKLYENLGFVRDKRLFRYYLNGVDALRLKLWLR